MGNPSRLEFHVVREPGRPLQLTWGRPAGGITGFVVLSTQHPFPPEMAAEFFAGRMREHFCEIGLGPEAAGFQTDKAAPFYTVLALNERGDWLAVDGLRESESSTAHVPLALDSVEFTQPRTLARARFGPRPEAQDFQVEVWVRPDPPAPDTLGAMLSAVIPPDFAVSARADGFVDNVTNLGFRVHYTAVCVDCHGGRRPLRLTVGAFQRLDAPALLNKKDPSRRDALNAAILEQLETELRFRGATAEELRPGFQRAWDLMSGASRLLELMARFEARFDEPV